MLAKINPIIIKDLVVIVMSGILLYYVFDLEQSKCLCSKNWKRDYIKIYSLSIIILTIISLFTPILDKCLAVKGIINMAGLLNLAVLYIYIRELKSSDCVCSMEKNEKIYEFLRLYSLLGIIVVVYASCVVLSIYINKLDIKKYKIITKK